MLIPPTEPLVELELGKLEYVEELWEVDGEEKIDGALAEDGELMVPEELELDEESKVPELLVLVPELPVLPSPLPYEVVDDVELELG